MAAPVKPNLIEHLSAKEKKQSYVTRMFEITANRYDFITVFLSYGMDSGWKRKLIEMLQLKGHERVLDLACGTGDITFAEGRKLTSGSAVGLDITQNMLTIAEQKRREMNVENVSFNRADIMALPYADATFDCVTGGYALRNVPDIPGALAEIKRVLKPGGRFFALDFGRPSWKLYDWAYLQYLTIVGALSGYVLYRDPDMYVYIPESLKRYPGQKGVQQLMTQAGLQDCGYHEFMGGIMAINWGTKR